MTLEGSHPVMQSLKKPVSAEADRVLHSFFPGISEAHGTPSLMCAPLPGLSGLTHQAGSLKSRLCYRR